MANLARIGHQLTRNRAGDLPDASFVEAGRFPALIPFLRGFLKVTHPGCNDLKVNGIFKNLRLRRLGFIWGELVMQSSSQVIKTLLPTAAADTRSLALFSRRVQEVDEPQRLPRIRWLIRDR